MNVGAYETLSDVVVRIGDRLNLDLKDFAIHWNGRYLYNNNSTGCKSGIELLNIDSMVGEIGIGEDSTFYVAEIPLWLFYSWTKPD
ncbi:hypothetical protein FCM35_KLT06657 [Carex littledalei]|uniref:Uncharacterized protein n=1 Tax=Carex littledalei TaxID=544730 RepID=A0A833QU99_9POAL|nr:hypothetical protein FCM35_KLT06657 [Carex littledalei]